MQHPTVRLTVPDDPTCLFCGANVPWENGCTWVWSHAAEQKLTKARMIENWTGHGGCYIMNESRRICSQCWLEYLLEQSNAAPER